MPKSEKLKEAIEIFGEDLINIAANMIKNEPKVNTGRLKGSLESRVLDTAFGTSYTLLVLAEDYFIYVDKGRKAGSKMPPLEPIRQWCRDREIPISAAYPIAKKIAEEGIPATNISSRMLKKALSDAAYRRLEDGVEDYVDDLILENFKGLSKKGNITFK